MLKKLLPGHIVRQCRCWSPKTQQFLDLELQAQAECAFISQLKNLQIQFKIIFIILYLLSGFPLYKLFKDLG